MSCISGTIRRLAEDERGESLVEVLVATLISALAMSLFALTIQTTYHIVSRGRDMGRTYYSATATLVTVHPTTPGTLDVTCTDGLSKNDIPVAWSTAPLPGEMDAVAYEVTSSTS